MKFSKFVLGMAVCFLFTHCGSKTHLEPSTDKSQIENKVVEVITLTEVNIAKTKDDMARFREVLKAGKKLSKADLALHESLLNTYVQLKYRPRNGVVHVPPKTKLVLPLRSYCLEGGKAEPHEEELFQWKKHKNSFLYLNEILDLSLQGRFSQEDLQGIIWGLHNKTLWENYPETEKQILKQIDPKAPLKLPSNIRSKVEQKIHEEIAPHVPIEIGRAFELVSGRYYDYQTMKDITESTKPSEPPQRGRVSSVEGVHLYVSNFSYGFERQNVSFYNTTDQQQILNLHDYYQQPYRKSVQAIAAYFGWSSEQELFEDLQKLLYEDMVRAGFGFVPGLNDLIDLYEASTGKNFFTDEYLTNQERFMAAIGVLAGSGEAYRYANKILHGPASYVDDVQKKYRLIKNTESYRTLEKLSRDAEKLNISDDWRVKVTKNKKRGNQGIEFISPENEHYKVRVMPGKSDSAYPNSRGDYIRVTKDKDSYNKHGVKVSGNSDDAHIPINEFDISKFPWIKKKRVK